MLTLLATNKFQGVLTFHISHLGILSSILGDTLSVTRITLLALNPPRSMRKKRSTVSVKFFHTHQDQDTNKHGGFPYKLRGHSGRRSSISLVISKSREFSQSKGTMYENNRKVMVEPELGELIYLLHEDYPKINHVQGT